MIGVIANSSDCAVISEFFELFKTPWEFYCSGRKYEVLLCAADRHFAENGAKLVIVYSGHEVSFDTEQKIRTTPGRQSNRILSRQGVRIPIYGSSLTFEQRGTGILVDQETNQAAIHQHKSQDRMAVRIGYDLFEEVRTLLKNGQPA